MEYFKHDINASQDDKICDLLASGGYELLGYYWRFIEYLYSRGGKIDKNKLNGVAWSLHMEIEKLLSVVYNYDLFCEDENIIFSKRVVTEIEEFEAIGKRMVEIGKAGGQASAQARAKRTVNRTVDHMLEENSIDGQAHAQQNKIKEKKENKIKENKIDKRERENTATPSPSHETEPPFKGRYNNVYLTDGEFEEIKKNFPNDWQDRIERLSKYMADTGKTYASHFDTILKWAKQDEVKNANPKQDSGSFDTDDFFEAAVRKTYEFAEQIKK